MRRIGLFLLAFVCLRPNAAGAQQVYAAVLLEYLTGDATAAIDKMRHLGHDEILAGMEAFNQTRALPVLRAAAALHTEAAFRKRPDLQLDEFQLEIATAIVEFGEKRHHKSNSPYAISPVFAAPVPDDFRRLWYQSVILELEDSTMYPKVEGYLAHGLSLYPEDGELQLLAGVNEEMRGSPRTMGLNAGSRRSAIRDAEKFYRAALARLPDRLEARLRLGRVLQQRGELADARVQLAPLVAAEDARIAYLSSLFLGGVEDASGNLDAALALYDKAVARVPIAQAARLAASELRHRRGERQAAADAVPPAAGDANIGDPWWTYVFGEYWREESLLDALRQMKRA